MVVVWALALAACGGTEPGAATTSAPVDVTEVTTSPFVDTTVDEGTDASPGGEDRTAELEGRWTISDYHVSGTLTNVVGDEPAFVAFGSDGSVVLHTGCNEGTGSYTTAGIYYAPDSGLDDTPEGQLIDFGPGFTMDDAVCDGFLGDQDADLPAQMSAVTRFTIDDDRLRLLDEFLLVEAARDG